MKQILFTSLAAAWLAAVGSAQCLDCQSPGTLIGTGDDVVFASHYPLGFNYPMSVGAGGAPGIPWSHFRVSTNGWLMLTDGTNSTGIPSGTDYGSQASLRGAAGSFPRIAPYWGDLEIDTFNVAGVYYRQIPASGSTPASCSICWVNANDYAIGNGTTPVKSFQARLFANGQIEFTYGRMNVNRGGSKIVGVSWGNGSGPVSVPQSVLVPGSNAVTQPRMWQSFPVGPFGPQFRRLQFNPLVSPQPAGWLQSIACFNPGGYFDWLGKGTLVLSDSIYQTMASSTVAGSLLSSLSIRLQPIGGEFVLHWGGASFVPPSAAATQLTLTDDSEVMVALGTPLPTPIGPQSHLRVHANGIVSWGAAAQTFPGTNSWTPTAAGMLDAANGGVWSWHDYNPSESGSGQVKYEEIGNMAYVTWDGVESHASPEVANPSTLQFQFDLNTGAIQLVWVDIDDNASSNFGSAHLVGYSPGGHSADAGSVDLAAALPLMTQPVNLDAMVLAGTPDPISTPTTGTTLTLTTSLVPEAAPGLYLGIHALSTTQMPLPGFDLASVGAPGVILHLGSLDVTTFVAGTVPTQSVPLSIPAGLPPGLTAYAQTFALVSGINALGVVASNGLQIYVADF